MSVVYLIHFDKPLGDLSNPRGLAQHYLGFTDDLDARMEAHASGNGARIMEVVSKAGISWQLVRTWDGNRDVERKLKDQHNAPRLCPVCRSGRQRTLPLVTGASTDELEF